MGSVDKDGFLSITGRKKEIIVSSNGKKIAPNDIEDHLKNFPYVSQVMLCGEGKPYCSAVFTINEDAVKRWFEVNGHLLEEGTKYFQDKRVKDLIWSHVEQVNAKLANFEQVRKITIVSGDFTVENGLLTPTFKVKRKTVENRFRDIIEQMY